MRNETKGNASHAGPISWEEAQRRGMSKDVLARYTGEILIQLIDREVEILSDRKRDLEALARLLNGDNTLTLEETLRAISGIQHTPSLIAKSGVDLPQPTPTPERGE